MTESDRQGGDGTDVGVAGVRRLLAPNPGPMTLTGTNTYVLDDAAGIGGSIVVDPGPDDADHLRRVASYGPVRLILTTHRHRDHTDGIPPLVELTGAPVRLAAELTDGARVGGELTVVSTPGHTLDSVCFRWRDAVLTGDSILGAGTTVVTHPDGDLGAYLASLERLRAVAAESTGPVTVLPGHGPVRPDLGAIAGEYLAHRRQRLAQVREALEVLGTTAADATASESRAAETAGAVVARVYADVDRSVWPAAEQTVRAQLSYLSAEGATT